MTTPANLKSDIELLNHSSHDHLIGECIAVSPDLGRADMLVRVDYSNEPIIIRDCIVKEERWGHSHATMSSISTRQYLKNDDGQFALDDKGNKQVDISKPGEYGLITVLGGFNGTKIVEFGIRVGPNWGNALMKQFVPEETYNDTYLPSHTRLTAEQEETYETGDGELLTVKYRDTMNGTLGESGKMHLRQRPDSLNYGAVQPVLTADPTDAEDIRTAGGIYYESVVPLFNRKDVTKGNSGRDELHGNELMSNSRANLLEELNISYWTQNEELITIDNDEQFIETFNSDRTLYNATPPSNARFFRISAIAADIELAEDVRVFVSPTATSDDPLVPPVYYEAKRQSFQSGLFITDQRTLIPFTDEYQGVDVELRISRGTPKWYRIVVPAR